MLNDGRALALAEGTHHAFRGIAASCRTEACWHMGSRRIRPSAAVCIWLCILRVSRRRSVSVFTYLALAGIVKLSAKFNNCKPWLGQVWPDSEKRHEEERSVTNFT